MQRREASLLDRPHHASDAWQRLRLRIGERDLALAVVVGELTDQCIAVGCDIENGITEAKCRAPRRRRDGTGIDLAGPLEPVARRDVEQRQAAPSGSRAADGNLTHAWPPRPRSPDPRSPPDAGSRRSPLR